MPPSIGTSHGSRGRLSDRVIIWKWSRPVPWDIATSVAAGLAGGVLLVLFLFAGFPDRFLANEFGDEPRVVLVAGCVGGVLGALIGVAGGTAAAASKGAERAALVGRSTAPWRMRLARQALRHGRLTGDVEANRIAAGIARMRARHGDFTRGGRTMLVLGGLMQTVCFLGGVLDANAFRMVFFGAAAVWFIGAAAIVNRTRRNLERVVALHAADEWSGSRRGSVSAPALQG
ncbi:hypothetical protein [Streptomonospora litoralis]|uniref:Uncharacterized protein n=1 Tax=Streptomonospora litoralis TaxID=2498135 RepID=A0A4P6Q7D5_9ACTN|nr:hypothetical protein [Streptomonospora litoralis]QBI56696.1 hypothetical protein EKD16_24770 [Streptomonospora litoralis]